MFPMQAKSDKMYDFRNKPQDKALKIKKEMSIE